MRYIKPPDFKSVKDLEGYYKQVEAEITELLTNDASARTADELNDKLAKALNAAVSYLTVKNKQFTTKELPTAFVEGVDSVHGRREKTKEEASAILEKQGFKYAKNGFSSNTYIELHSALVGSTNALKKRVNDTIKQLRKEGKDSVYNVQQAIIREYETHSIFEVEYSNGAKQPLHAYAAMAARSARIESTNIGAIGSALQTGTDLVEMTTMPQCCKLCGAYQGKVYSISGRDKRFPALFKTVLKNGYALPHPNCRHEFIPFYEEMEAPEDIEKAIQKSKIKYDKQGQLIDVRYQKDIKAYQAWQAGNRQLNAEYLEFERMRKHYAGREEEMPYKTLAGFRRARRADDLSPAFKAWRHQKMDTNTLERWKTVENFRNCPKTVENLQEIKYNKDTTKWEQLKRERKTISDINGKPWTDSFKAKAVDTYYEFREYGVEFTDHGVARFLARMSKETFLDIHKKPFNFVQADGRLVKFYDNKAIIYNGETKEIVSCYVDQKRIKDDWSKIKN